MIKGILQKLKGFLIEDLPEEHFARDGIVVYECNPRSGRMAIALERGGQTYMASGFVSDPIAINRVWAVYAADKRLDFDWFDASYMSRIVREFCDA